MNLKSVLSQHSDTLTISYESLRSLALGSTLLDSRGSNGLALFLYRGMSTWMEAWPKCYQSSGDVKRTKGNGTVVKFPASVQNELVVQLANMSLAANGG